MSNFYHLFLNEKKAILAGIALGIISGLLSFVFLTFFNFMIGNLIAENYKAISIQYILIFVLIAVIFIWSRRAMALTFIKFSQNLFWKLRTEILSIVIKSNYEDFDKRRAQIQSALIHDVGILTQASLNIVHFITSTVVLLSCLAYMCYLSGTLFLITLTACLLGVSIYILGSKRNNRLFIETRKLEDGFMKNFSAIMDGFREIHMNKRKGESIMSRNIKPIAELSYKNNTKAFAGFLNNQIIGQVLFYLLIGVILLVFSVKLEIESIVVINFLFILLYVLGALEGIMVLIPSLSQALVSFRRLKRLKDDLNTIEHSSDKQENQISIQEFRNIVVENIEFKYQSDEEESFHIGPVSFELNKQEIVFIYGGNGSGKTTFVHALLGLLKPHSGSLKFNDSLLGVSNYSSYKGLFSVVFNEFYLFEEFFGNEDFDKKKAREYLKLFEIEEKVGIEENGFSTVDLSTGQRKRLALIAALLENNPVIVLDEWAADQDPYFRKKFYEEILPYLKKEGFTILAITHDDRYYHCADKIFKMEFGKLHDETLSFKTP